MFSTILGGASLALVGLKIAQIIKKEGNEASGQGAIGILSKILLSVTSIVAACGVVVDLNESFKLMSSVRTLASNIQWIEKFPDALRDFTDSIDETTKKWGKSEDIMSANGDKTMKEGGNARPENWAAIGWKKSAIDFLNNTKYNLDDDHKTVKIHSSVPFTGSVELSPLAQLGQRLNNFDLGNKDSLFVHDCDSVTINCVYESVHKGNLNWYTIYRYDFSWPFVMYPSDTGDVWVNFQDDTYLDSDGFINDMIFVDSEEARETGYHSVMTNYKKGMLASNLVVSVYTTHKELINSVSNDPGIFSGYYVYINPFNPKVVEPETLAPTVLHHAKDKIEKVWDILVDHLKDNAVPYVCGLTLAALATAVGVSYWYVISHRYEIASDLVKGVLSLDKVDKIDPRSKNFKKNHDKMVREAEKIFVEYGEPNSKPKGQTMGDRKQDNSRKQLDRENREQEQQYKHDVRRTRTDEDREDVELGNKYIKELIVRRNAIKSKIDDFRSHGTPGNERHDAIMKQMKDDWNAIIKEIDNWYSSNAPSQGNGPKVTTEDQSKPPEKESLVPKSILLPAKEAFVTPLKSKTCPGCQTVHTNTRRYCTKKCFYKNKNTNVQWQSAPPQASRETVPLTVKQVRFDVPKEVRTGKPPPQKTVQIDPKPRSKVKIEESQSSSSYTAFPASTEFHNSMISIFSEELNPLDDHYCGTICKINYKDKNYWLSTKHQLTNDVYCVIGNKQIPLKTLGWINVEFLEDRDITLLPADKLQAQAKAITAARFTNGRHVACLVAIDPRTRKTVMCPTNYEFDGTVAKLAHSASTANYWCGSLLIEEHKIIGIHVSTSGPSKQGGNNYVQSLF
jgi:hypothetical protein